MKFRRPPKLEEFDTKGLFFLASHIQEVIENSLYIGKREGMDDPETRVLREPFTCL